MGFKEEVIELIDQCNRNIVFHTHAVQQAQMRGIDVEKVLKALQENIFLDAIPNFNERKTYHADKSFIIKITQSKKYQIEAVAYFYIGNKVLIATVYKS